MANRRAFLTGMIAAGFCPKPTWAAVGDPRYLSAGMKPDGRYVLCGLSDQGQITFERPIPARGHAAAAHPTLAEAVAFARRPGRFAVVIDCVSGAEKARLHTPEGRHFCGHGAFSPDGDLLFTTENDYDSGRGVIGVWDARNRYARIDEFPTGGIGPHDIRLMPGRDTLVIANGGIETHPETGRTKLNIPTMRPNLSFVDLNGGPVAMVELDPDLHKNSIRHLAVAADGTVAFAMQWQGDKAVNPPLLGLHRPGFGLALLGMSDEIAALSGYIGSVAISDSSNEIAITSPRGGVLQTYDLIHYNQINQLFIDDVCGVATGETGFFVTSGLGKAIPTLAEPGRVVDHQIRWDNHLVAI